MIKALFAKSGNVCAFPGCTHELVTVQNKFVAQICHIEAVNSHGPRYNPDSSDEERRQFENLIIFCHQHHKETDDETTYPVNWLKQIKAKHESQFLKNPFKVNESFIYQLEREMQEYWEEIEKANQTEHIVQNLAVEIKVSLSPVEHFRELGKAVRRIQEFTEMLRELDESLNEEIRRHLNKIGYDLRKYDSIRYYKNPFILHGWELHNLGIPNSFTNLYVLLLQAEVRFLEEYLKTHSKDGVAIQRFEQVKQELRQVAVSAGYAD